VKKQSRSMETRIKESKMRPWCKRLFLFILSQGVQCQKDDVKMWNKAVMIQKQVSDKHKIAVATCSFVASAAEQLPKLSGTPEKVLTTLYATLKKYGELLWFLITEEKLFVVLNVFRQEQALRMLKDHESRQVHGDIIRSLGSDFYNDHSRITGSDWFVVTFCQSDIINIRNKFSETESPEQAPSPLDQKANPHQEEAREGERAPFSRNQRVEVFSKTTAQWVEANVVCVQKDNEGIFVTVKRVDGHELDYDIANVRPIMQAPIRSNSSFVAKEDANAKQFYQLGDFESNTSPPEYLKPKQPPDQKSNRRQPQPSAHMISDAELFKRMETFHIFDKIRSVKSWLQRMIKENEPVPRMIAEELKEVTELLAKRN